VADREPGRPVPIALCADDYAIAPGVDEAIVELASSERITAFSCMTASPRWKKAAERINPLFGKIDIGLHFTLTQLAPIGPMPQLAPDGRFPSMRRLYAQAFFRRVDLTEIEAEFRRQIDAFTGATGRVPDFIDGHHHVHELPGIRDVVARVWGRRERWIRNTATGAASILGRGVVPLRAAALASIGGAARRTWQRAGIATNAHFSGVRSFAEPSFGALMRKYLSGARAGLLIMCHPGQPDAELAAIDTVTESRADEFAYLSGPEFPADLAAAGCRLARLSVITTPQ
jgi:chitin disaccharide deacetylase